ncbi:hypothetical protein E2542_SST08408 [Spatholobus suberectus]|nr:hypothetical protein E2542_SST08408 [Spatholobus suberectus]
MMDPNLGRHAILSSITNKLERLGLHSRSCSHSTPGNRRGSVVNKIDLRISELSNEMATMKATKQKAVKEMKILPEVGRV